jgi:hypothetical protein
MSPVKFIAALVGCAAFTALGVWFVGWSETLAESTPRFLREIGAARATVIITGWASILFFGGGAILLVRRISRGRRLAIAADRVLMVEGADRVIGEIPFDNIARVDVTEAGIPGARQSFVAFWVIAPDRPDTRWPGGERLRTMNRGMFGFDYAIETGYVEPPCAILDRITRRMSARLPPADTVAG